MESEYLVVSGLVKDDEGMFGKVKHEGFVKVHLAFRHCLFEKED